MRASLVVALAGVLAACAPAAWAQGFASQQVATPEKPAPPHEQVATPVPAETTLPQAAAVVPQAAEFPSDIAAQFVPPDRAPPVFASRSEDSRKALAARLGAKLPTGTSSFVITPVPGHVTGRWQLVASGVQYSPAANELSVLGSQTGTVTLFISENTGGRHLVDCEIETPMRAMGVYVGQSDDPLSIKSDYPVVDGRLSFITMVTDAPTIFIMMHRSYSQPAIMFETAWTFRGCEVTPLPAP